MVVVDISSRFPKNTPKSKEAYYYRTIFEELFPQPSAALTVPGGPSIACSTPRAIEWDESFKDRADPSGRAVAGVHDSSYDEHFNAEGNVEGEHGNKRKAEAVATTTNGRGKTRAAH